VLFQDDFTSPTIDTGWSRKVESCVGDGGLSFVNGPQPGKSAVSLSCTPLADEAYGVILTRAVLDLFDPVHASFAVKIGSVAPDHVFAQLINLFGPSTNLTFTYRPNTNDVLAEILGVAKYGHWVAEPPNTWVTVTIDLVPTTASQATITLTYNGTKSDPTSVQTSGAERRLQLGPFFPYGSLDGGTTNEYSEVKFCY
jgi:hypothetical protein